MTVTPAVPGSAAAGTWRQLLGRKYLGTSTVLAGGVALYAINELLTISLLPSAVADIGGARLYAWVTTVYLVTSVVAATTVPALLVRWGPRGAYLLALGVFGPGSVICAAATGMDILLVGRAVQGIGGGLLAGLGYAVINTTLPKALWTKASALVSAMWGVGTLVGPAAGGVFAQFGVWRWAFGALAVCTAVMAVLAPVTLPPRRRADLDALPPPLGVPVLSLLLLGAAALVVSAAGVPANIWGTAGLLGLGAVLVALFLRVDRRRSAAVLPRSVFRPGPHKWIYLTLGVLMAATMVTMYVPLFGQRLAHLSPVVAGFVGAALSVGWTVGEISSASLSRDRVIARVVTVAPLVMAGGLAVSALTFSDDFPVAMVVLWVVALIIAGTGIGIAWPHLSAAAMMRVDDPAEGPTAAAAINTVQLMCGAFGAGLAGVVVNLTDTGGAAPARWLFAVFAVLVAVGTVASHRAMRAPA